MRRRTIQDLVHLPLEDLAPTPDRTAREKMAAFDRLPRAVKLALSNSPFDLSPIKVLERFQWGGEREALALINPCLSG